MAEPPALAPAGAAASERDVLLATKLHVPRPQPGFVARYRLARALGEALARQLVVVCAPAGFGKTALLADWVAFGGKQVDAGSGRSAAVPGLLDPLTTRELIP